MQARQRLQTHKGVCDKAGTVLSKAGFRCAENKPRMKLASQIEVVSSSAGLKLPAFISFRGLGHGVAASPQQLR